MANPYIPRNLVHGWSETIGAEPQEHQAALTRLLRDQRRLSRFVEENAEQMGRGSDQITMYLVGVVARMFDLAGGRLKAATWEQVRDASAKVQKSFAGLLPVDEGFPTRVRAVEGRAQPHVLDEALLALFERESKPGEPDLANPERAKVFLVLWVCTEVLDANWQPPKTFSGESSYTFVKIDA